MAIPISNTTKHYNLGKQLLVLMFLGSMNLLMAQAPLLEWQGTYGGTGPDVAIEIQPTTDGGYIVTGYSNSDNNGDVTGNHGVTDFWVVKIDNTGTIQWQKSLGGSGQDHGQSGQQTADGGYIIGGYTTSNDGDVIGFNGGHDFWAVKLDSNGNIEWQNPLGGSVDDYGREIKQTADGGYIMIGFTYSNNGDVSGNHGEADYWVVKLDASGAIQWEKTLGGTSTDEGDSIQQTADGGYIATGHSFSSDGDVTSGNQGLRDYWVVKLDSNGTIEWENSMGGSATDYGWHIIQTTDGGYIVAGDTSSDDGDVTGHQGISDYWVVKLNSTGDIQWEKTLGGSLDDEAKSIRQDTDGGYLVAGISGSMDGDVSGNIGGPDFWVVKLDPNGNLLWEKSLGGSSNEGAEGIQLTSDGGYIVAGYTASNDGDVSGNHGNLDFWVTKLSGSLGSPENELSASVTLYPNPAKEKLTIHSQTPLTICKVYDTTGKLIRLFSLEDSFFNTIDVSRLHGGFYFLELNTVANRKLVRPFVKL